jgi:hypothetical protein
VNEAVMDTLSVFGVVAVGLILAAVIYATVQEMMAHRHIAAGGLVQDAYRAAVVEDTGYRVDAILHRLSYDIDGEKLLPTTHKRGC